MSMAVEEQDKIQLEFKSGDDAWYDVTPVIKDSQLIVQYSEFPGEDDKFAVEDFESVRDLKSKFRFSSEQLQDQNCGKVKQGMHICASYSCINETRFFDAVVKRVCRSKHHRKGGEEVCRCTFEVLWKDGPCANKNTSVSCENICLMTSGSIESHPVIKAFVKLVEEKVEQSLHRNTLKKNSANVKGSCIKSGHERVENLLDSFKQNVGSGNKIEAVFSGINKVAASSPHMSPISSQFHKMKELSDDRLNAVDNVVTDSEVLLQDHVSISEVMGSQNNISRSSQGKESKKILKTTVEGPLCTSNEITNEAPHSGPFLIKREETHLDLVRKERKKEKICLDVNSKVELEQEQLDIPSHSEAFLMKQEETCLDSGRKKEKLSLDLNSKVELEQEQLDIPTTRVNGFLGISRNVGSPENQGPFHSGWLEAEDCGTLQSGKGGFNAFKDEIAGNSACLTADIRNKGSELSDDKNNQKMQVPSRHNFENAGEQVIVGEDKNDEKIREKRKVLASSWGKGKRQKHINNELFAGERKVQDYNQTGENVNTSKKLIQDGNDFDGVDSLSPSSLTLHLKNSTNYVTTETLDLNRQIDNHAQLQEGLTTSEEIKEGCTCTLDLERCQSCLASKKCESSSLFKIHSRPAVLHTEQTHRRTFADNIITDHCEYSLYPSECRCCDLHSCYANASSEDESFDGDTRIYRDHQEARCGCNGAELGHCSEDLRAEDGQINYSEVLVLDNLEKDVRPFDVKKVIGLASVTCAVQVYIFPSHKFELFTRGFVWFQDHSSLMKALAFLQDDDFFIISSNGRPWVALLLHIDDEVCKGIFGGYDVESKDCRDCCLKTLPPSKILFVRKGTDEYERAKIRKNMFLEFKDHLAILHKRLELEECSRH